MSSAATSPWISLHVPTTTPSVADPDPVPSSWLEAGMCSAVSPLVACVQAASTWEPHSSVTG